jgi:hypothetical protein
MIFIGNILRGRRNFLARQDLIAARANYFPNRNAVFRAKGVAF